MAVSHLEKLKILLVFRSLIRTFARMMMEWQRLRAGKNFFLTRKKINENILKILVKIFGNMKNIY